MIIQNKLKEKLYYISIFFFMIFIFILYQLLAVSCMYMFLLEK